MIETVLHDNFFNHSHNHQHNYKHNHDYKYAALKFFPFLSTYLLSKVKKIYIIPFVLSKISWLIERLATYFARKQVHNTVSSTMSSEI